MIGESAEYCCEFRFFALLFRAAFPWMLPGRIKRHRKAIGIVKNHGSGDRSRQVPFRHVCFVISTIGDLLLSRGMFLRFNARTQI